MQANVVAGKPERVMSQKRFVAHHNVPIQSKISKGIADKKNKLAIPYSNIIRNDINPSENSRRTPGISITVSDATLTKR